MSIICASEHSSLYFKERKFIKSFDIKLFFNLLTSLVSNKDKNSQDKITIRYGLNEFKEIHMCALLCTYAYPVYSTCHKM